VAKPNAEGLYQGLGVVAIDVPLLKRDVLLCISSHKDFEVVQPCLRLDDRYFRTFLDAVDMDARERSFLM
jgi:hypothetical protein